MKSFRIILISAVSVLLAVLCCACNGTGTGDATTAGVPDDTQPPAAEPLVLPAGEGKKFVIVRAESAGETVKSSAASLLAAFRKSGFDPGIQTDWERNPVNDCEIIVGETARESADFYVADRELLGDGYLIKVIGSKILITGGNDAGTELAVDRFISEFLGGTGKTEELRIPADYELTYSASAAVQGFDICGTPLSSFKIYDDGTHTGKINAVRQELFAYAGVIIDRTDKTGGNLIELSENDGSAFTLSATDGKIKLETGKGVGFTRGLVAFGEEVLSAAGEGFKMDNGYRFTKDYGSFVTYEQYGAKGDGKHDDIDALVAAHAYANENNLPVLAREGAEYYIGGAAKRVTIQTDTDWTGASFIIDDTAVENRGVEVFRVSSRQGSYSLLDKVKSLKAGQTNIGCTLEKDCLVTAVNTNVLRYIRYGANQNSGSAQTDVFRVDRNGNVDPSTPILWDFDVLTSMTAIPIDEETLTLKGGRITTIANKETSAYTYYYRGIRVYRSNVVVDGLEHYITGEGASGAPYYGILIFHSTADITVKNCVFTGHKTYKTIGSAGTSVSMGTYELTVTASVNVSVINCRQTNDILDNKYWGVYASNYGKNLVFDGCVFSRFDAHQGVANATIKNSKLGHQGINLIGSGTCLIENTTVYSANFVNLRSDYGSTWDGDIIIRNCTFVPSGGNTFSKACVINGSNNGSHDFGYTCYLPATVTIEGFHVEDAKADAGYKGVYLFANINSSYTSAAYKAQYPMVMTKSATVSGLTSDKGFTMEVSPNKFMFTALTVDFK